MRVMLTMKSLFCGVKGWPSE